MLKRNSCAVAENQDTLRTRLRDATVRQAAKRLQLFQRKFDWLFFLARDEIVSRDDPRAGIPSQDRIVVTGRANRLSFFEPTPCLAQKIRRLKPAIRRRLPPSHLRA